MYRLPIATLLIACSAASAQTQAYNWQLLIPGQYHSDEAPAKPGLGWLALAPVGGVWRLEPAIAKATLVHDAVLDGNDDKTGVEISAGFADAIALLRVPGFTPGKVDTPNMQFKDKRRQLASDAPLQISFKGREYSLHVIDSTVFLRSGDGSTALEGLVAGNAESEDTVALLWAGDLDRDGKLDLLLSTSGYNSSGVCLFLSGKAQANGLVGLLACHRGVGC
jgi:hypothetical protein